MWSRVGACRARSGRFARIAHYGTQYLGYDYGRIAYVLMMTYLQTQLPSGAPTVDPYLLQACAINSLVRTPQPSRRSRPTSGCSATRNAAAIEAVHGSNDAIK